MKKLTKQKKIILGVILILLILPLILSITYVTFNQFSLVTYGGDHTNEQKFVCSNFETWSHNEIPKSYCSWEEFKKESWNFIIFAYYSVFFGMILIPFYIFPVYWLPTIFQNNHYDAWTFPRIVMSISPYWSFISFLLWRYFKKKEFSKKKERIFQISFTLSLVVYLFSIIFLSIAFIRI
jgi:hypothetical protein